MINEIFGEDVSTFIVFFFIAWWIKYILIDSPKAEKKIKEQKIKENKQKKMEVENALQAERNLINKANDLLPDTQKALECLTSKYGWHQILDVFGLSPIHLELLSQIRLYGEEPLELPNLQASKFNDDEKYLIQQIQSKSSPQQYGDPEVDESNLNHFYDELTVYGIDAHSHEPTVGMLQDLINSNLVTTSEELTNNRRVYTCLLTKQGSILADMHTIFKPLKMAGYFERPSSEVRSDVFSFLCKMLHT
jgi:hypothetical protein